MADQDQIDSEMMGQPIMTDPGHPFTFNREVPMPQQTYEQITAPMRSERKQNSACDACRLRKVKCFKQPGEEKCQHCKAKKLECTRYYVTLASSYSNKRGTKRTRAPATEGSSYAFHTIPYHSSSLVQQI
ncbi:hypothetical protein BT69DRAFT_1287473 [Atractiella rhizophila]|nr:hypothetical protein BT69DRAFT_1287473 [Atractiella rhizophila]